MASPAEYLVRRGIELQHAGRDEEAITVYREAVILDPAAYPAWLHLAMLVLHRHPAEAYAAFAQFARTAPADHPMVGMATTILRDAGQEVPDSAASLRRRRWVGDVHFDVKVGGKRMLLMADNDSGVEPRELLDVLTEFNKASSWLDAYLIIVGHPELFSDLASTLLDFYAGQGDDRQLAYRARASLAVFARAREIGLLAAFAEADQTPAEEFRELVRAKREIEPVLRRLDGLTSDELWQRLDDVPWLSSDDGTYVLLARLGESASDERRATLAMLRLLLERHARGEPGASDKNADHGPGEDLANKLQRAAAAATDDTVDQVGRAAERLLAGDGELSAFWRVEITRIAAQCYLRFGIATNDLAALARAETVLTAVAALLIPETSQDADIAVTYADIGMWRYEMSGTESALALAAERLIAARERVGRYRTADAFLLRALGSILTLRARRHGRCRTSARCHRVFLSL